MNVKLPQFTIHILSDYKATNLVFTNLCQSCEISVAWLVVQCNAFLNGLLILTQFMNTNISICIVSDGQINVLQLINISLFKLVKK